MKIKKELLRLYEEYPFCEKCNAIMERNNKIMERGKIVYECPKCHDRVSLTEVYPRQITEKVSAVTKTLSNLQGDK